MEFFENDSGENGEDLRGLELARREFEERRRFLKPSAVVRIERLIEQKKHLSVMAEVWDEGNMVNEKQIKV